MTAPRRRFIALPWRSTARIASELDDELRFHADMRAEELAASGVPVADAKAMALRELMDARARRGAIVASDAANAWHARLARALEELAQDVRYALRATRRAPGYAAVTSLTLALAIGANTAIFSVVKAVLLDRLPYRESDRLVLIQSGREVEKGEPHSQISAADYVDLEREQRSLTGMAPMAPGEMTFTGEQPEVWQAARVGGRFFDVLGAPAMIGRTFIDGDAQPGAPPVVVLSHAAWRRVFGGDSSIIGKSITLNDRARTVVGVMPATFEMPFFRVDAWSPLDLTPMLADAVRARKFHWFIAIGRLKPGVTLVQAKSDLKAISVRLAERYPESNQDIRSTAFALREQVVGDARPSLIVLAAAAALVLLLACANVAGVLVARTLARRRELAVRVSLGASRRRLVRQLMTESAVLALAGGVVGLAIGLWGERVLVQLGGGSIPNTAHVAVDQRVLVFTAAIALGSALLFGLAPALVGARGDVHEALKATAPGAGGLRGRGRVRTVLVIGQVALSVVLLVGAGLLARTLAAIERVDLGYQTSGMLTFHVSLGRAYETGASETAFFDALFTRLRRLPGTKVAAAAGSLPLNGTSGASIRIENVPFVGSQPPEVRYGAVSDDYFRALGIPIVAGRAFDAREIDNGPHSVIITQSVVKKFFEGRDPIGAHVKIGPNADAPWETVVAVVGDVRSEATGAPEPTVYESMRQDHWGGGDVVIVAKPGVDPMSMLAAARAEVKSIDKSLAMTSVRTMDQLFSQSLAARRLPMLLLGAFAALALVLATVGVYSVMAYSVAARTREFGIRMALGARAREVLGLVTRQALATTLAGVVLGVIAAIAATRFLASLLFGVEPLDVPTFAAVPLLMIGATLLAAWLPARRATRVDVVETLRND